MKKPFTLFYIIYLFIPGGIIFSQVDKIAEKCPQGMISYWQLDEFGDVSMFSDSYGGHFAKVLNNVHPTQDSGIVNSSRFFYNSSSVTVPNNEVYNWGTHTSFSIELWIKTTQPGTGNKVFIGRYSTNTQAAWWLGFGNNNKAIFLIRDSSGVSVTLEGKKIINDGKWHHIVGVRNDSLKVMQLFVDGIQDNIISTFFTGDFSGDSPIYIGYYTDAFHYSGWLDEIAVYNIALNKTIIENHYKNGLEGKSYCDQFTTDIKGIKSVPVQYSLGQNYPNPFNPTTHMNFSISNSGNVNLTIYNILGEKISTLVNRFLKAGTYSMEFDASKLSSGIYFYELRANNFMEVKKMILQK